LNDRLKTLSLLLSLYEHPNQKNQYRYQENLNIIKELIVVASPPLICW
jgi:hypothetical protein